MMVPYTSLDWWGALKLLMSLHPGRRRSSFLVTLVMNALILEVHTMTKSNSFPNIVSGQAKKIMDRGGVTADHWHVLGRETVFAAPPYVAISRERIRTGAGVIVDDFYQVELATFSLCVPQIANGEVITLWAYNHGPRRFGLGFPAGFVEPREAPDAACVRELAEETGFAPGVLESLGAYVDNGNQRGSLGHYFVARDCEIVAAPQNDDLERAQVRLMRPEAIDAALVDGQFSVIHHVAAWALARPRLL